MYSASNCHQVQPQFVQELTDALTQVWEEICQDTIRGFTRRIPMGAIHATESHYEVGSACDLNVLLLLFSESSPQWVDDSRFH